MTRILIKTLILIGFIAIENQSFAQWDESGNPLLQTGIFGSTTNWDVLFRTDNVNRMQLMQSSTNTVDGYFYDNSGFLGISQDPAFFTSQEPFSLLHLNGNNASFPTQGYQDCLPAFRQGCWQCKIRILIKRLITCVLPPLTQV